MDPRNDRMRGLRARMAEAGLPALLLESRENLHYLTGYPGEECHLIVTPDRAYLLADPRNLELAAATATGVEAVRIDAVRTAHAFIKELGLPGLGVEEKRMTLHAWRMLGEATGSALLAGDGLVEALRLCKDETEQSKIVAAQELTDACFSHMLGFLAPGMTERKAAWEIERYLREAGADALSFETICVSGARTSMPHGTPSDKVIERGDLVTMDFGCIVDGYCSDMTRTVAIGTVSQEQRDVYRIVREAQEATLAVLRPGLSCKEADAAARDRIGEAGYGEAFGHGTGHGVGLEIHEAPTMNPRSAETLQTGMVVTVEPGIYLPGRFGVRIEDLAILGDSSIINTTRSEKELLVL